MRLSNKTVHFVGKRMRTVANNYHFRHDQYVIIRILTIFKFHIVSMFIFHIFVFL